MENKNIPIFTMLEKFKNANFYKLFKILILQDLL